MYNLKKSTQSTGLDFLLLNNTQMLCGHNILILREGHVLCKSNVKKTVLIKYLLYARKLTTD